MNQLAINISVTSLVASLAALALSLWVPKMEAPTGISGPMLANLILIWVGIFSLHFRLSRLAKKAKKAEKPEERKAEERKGSPDTVGTDRS